MPTTTFRCLLVALLASLTLTISLDAKEKEKKMPQVGDVAPEFEMQGSDGKSYKLSDFKGKSAVIVAWYPKASTPGWTIECKSLRASGEALRAFNVALFGASCDAMEDNVAFAKKLDLDFPLLSDTDKKVAEAYGILSSRGFSNRVTIIIDVEGKIAAMETKVTPDSHGADLAKKLKELKIPAAKRWTQRPLV